MSSSIPPSPEDGSKPHELTGSELTTELPESMRKAGVDDEESNEPTVISSQAPAKAASALRTNSQLLRELLEGRILGHFRLDELVGGGGMGAVFRGADLQLGRTVAIKVLAPTDRAAEETTRRFHNEAMSAARLDHDHIARVYFSGEEDGWQFIAFEFVEGQNIRDMVQDRGPLPLSEALQYAMHVAEALEHASEQGVVHRDIKPSNIIVTLDGRAKLVDMGLARFEQLEAHDEELTASGMTLGTFDYISPEQAENPREADVRSDIYSLGCTLYHMLVGNPPFPGGAPFEKLLRHKGEAIPDVRDARPELPNSLVQLLNRMLAKQPADRYQQPSDLLRDLRLVFNEDALGPAAARVANLPLGPRPTRRFVRTHVPWALPVSLLLGIAAAAHYGPDSDLYANIQSQWEALQRNQAAHSDAPSDKSGSNEDAASRGDDDNSTDADSNLGSSNSIDADDPSEPPPVEADDSADAGTEAPLPQATNVDDAYEIDLSTVVVVPRPSGSRVNEVGSLPEAIAFARRNDLRSIELRFDGSINSLPITIHDQALEIRAADRFQPVVNFRPGEEFFEAGVLGRNRLDMIRVINSTLKIRGVHFRADFQNAITREWSMFQMAGTESLEFHDSIFTLVGGPAGFNGDVAFVDVDHTTTVDSKWQTMERNGTEAFISDIPPSADRASLTLRDCVVRGESLLLRMTDPIPIQVTWENGLFVSTERLIQIGSRQNPSQTAEFAEVELDLANVTVAADDGLMFLSDDEVNDHELSVVVSADDSLFIVDAPLVTHQGQAQLKFDQDQFVFQGRRNGYVTSADLYRLEHGTEVTNFNFAEWFAMWTPESDDEILSLPSRSGIPAHQRSIEDYIFGDLQSLPTPKGMIPGALPRESEPAPADAGLGT